MSGYPNNPGSTDLTTKGDLLGFDTGENRLPVGVDGSILAADSGATLGLTYEAAQYRLMSRTVIAQGTVSYTVPDDCRAILIECIGAGGGGGGCTSAAVSGAAAGGGGGGGYASFLKVAPKLTAFTVAVGAGGLAGTNAGGAGGIGGDTSFDTGPNLCLAKGGVGGVGDTAGTSLLYQTGGAGGSAASGIGDVILKGSPGSPGVTNSGLIGASGSGGAGAGALGGGGGIAMVAAAPGNGGSQYGGGGGGALVLNGSAAAVGGLGANGLIVVWEFA
jgi:hypothetical protein